MFVSVCIFLNIGIQLNGNDNLYLDDGYQLNDANDNLYDVDDGIQLNVANDNLYLDDGIQLNDGIFICVWRLKFF